MFFDPLGRPHSRPVVINVLSGVVRLYVRPHFSKQNKFQAKTRFIVHDTSESMGLAEWIIDAQWFFFKFYFWLRNIKKMPSV